MPSVRRGCTRTALASPSPPVERAKVERVCAAASVWRAENLTKARPHVLVVASGMGLNVFRSHSTQPKVGSGGATHEEEEVRSLGIIHPRDALEETLLFCGLPSRKCWTNASWPMGTPSTFKPYWTGGNMGSSRRTTAPGFTVRAARVRTSMPLGSVPLCSTLASSHGASGCVHGTEAPPRRQQVPHPLVNVVQAKQANTYSPPTLLT